MSRFEISAQAIKKKKYDSRESLESERFMCKKNSSKKPDLKLTNYYLTKGQVKFHRNA